MTMVQPVLFDTELGLALRLQAAAALLLLAAQSLLARTRQLAVALSVAAVALLAIAPGLGGHPAAHDFPKLALAASFVHVAGVGLWLGTLAVLTLVSKRLPDAALATALRRFHRIAAIGVVAVVGTGVAKLVDLQPALALLSDSTWGLALIAKLGAFALVAVLGLKHWRGADAAVAAGEREALLRSFARELGLALIVLACTAVLINSSPPERASLATGNSTSIFP
jgi:copper transport protein